MPKWTHISKKAARTLHKRTHCADCGKYSDLLHEYFFYDDTSAGLLCDGCAGQCWCLGCGYFMAGLEKFDFSPVQGWCRDCLSEFSDDGGAWDEFAEYEDEYEDDF